MLVYIISNVDKAIAFEWISDAFEKEERDLRFILLNAGDSYLEQFLKKHNRNVYRITLKSKKDYPLVFFKLLVILYKWKPKVIHTHLRDANLLGLFAAKVLGIKKRIYTRHSSTYNHVYHPHAVKYDKLCNKWATDIVAISKNVENVLLEEKVDKHKIHLIHHGFDLQKFQNVPCDQIEKLRNKYFPKEYYPVVGIISRYIDWKGHKYIIPALKSVLKKYPNVHFILANTSGSDEQKIKQLLEKYLPKEHYTEVKFEKNLFALYQLFDVYVHTPIDETIEAFGQTYVEALAAKVPSVFTLSGVASEFIQDRKNALIVPFKNSEAINDAICLLLEDDDLRSNIKEGGVRSIQGLFNLELFIKKQLELNS